MEISANQFNQLFETMTKCVTGIQILQTNSQQTQATLEQTRITLQQQQSILQNLQSEIALIKQSQDKAEADTAEVKQSQARVEADLERVKDDVNEIKIGQLRFEKLLDINNRALNRVAGDYIKLNSQVELLEEKQPA